MGDVSNKTIVSLLAVALVITVVGTLVSVSKLGDLGGEYTYISGAATTSGSGTTYLQITSSTEITLRNNAINFSTGQVNTTSGTAECYINVTQDGSSAASNSFTNAYSGAKSVNCIDFQVPPLGFEVENTGSETVNVSMNSSSGATWLGGTASEYKYRVYSENSACDSETTSWTDMPSADPVVCQNLANTAANSNAFIVPVQVRVVPDVDVTQHTDTVTFTGTNSI